MFLPLFDFSGVYWRTYSSKRNKCMGKEGDPDPGLCATGLGNNRSQVNPEDVVSRNTVGEIILQVMDTTELMALCEEEESRSTT